MINTEDLDGFVEHSRKEFEDRLQALVNVPSVSMDPDHKPDVMRAANLGAMMIREFGGQAEVVQTDGYPVVLGEMGYGPDVPTVTIYNHLDVQPADPSEWHRDPFTFHVEGDRYEGRGATDDKGPALTALFAARYALLRKLPLNIRFIWELEEEIGSPSFDAFLKTHAARCKTDSVLVSDTVWLSRDRPAIPYGLRGLLGAQLILETGTRSTHSGTTGGVARNPIGELCHLIDSIYDAQTGEVKMPGFYDKVRQPSAAEVENYVNSGFDVSRFQKIYDFHSMRTTDSKEAVLRLMARPTFEVHGIVGGYSGPGVKTIVPHRAEAKVSMRMVPDMTGEQTFELLKRFVRQVNPDVQVIHEATLPPYLGDFGGPYNEAAARAVEFGFGRKPVFTREGGSIGAVLSMQQHLQAPIVFIGMSLPEHGYHEPNENYDWGQASGGMKTFVNYLSQLAAMPAQPAPATAVAEGSY